MEVFSTRLKWLREKRGYSQKQLSDILGVSQPYYFKFEKGSGEPSIEILLKISNEFDESLDFLIGKIDFDLTCRDAFRFWAILEEYLKQLSMDLTDLLVEYEDSSDEIIRMYLEKRKLSIERKIITTKQKIIEQKEILSSTLLNIPSNNDTNKLAERIRHNDTYASIDFNLFGD